MKSFPVNQTDWYKVSHKGFMNEGTSVIYSNMTPRSTKHANVMKHEDVWDDKVAFFGLMYVMQDYLIDEWNREFFDKPKEKVVGKFKRRCDTSLGEGAVDPSHIEALHDLGYLPVVIKALPEGSKVRAGTAQFTITNTHPDFAWLTNYLETVLSCEMWQPCTSATTANHYLQILRHFADKTGTGYDHIPFQAHDFSFRGMPGRAAAAISGAAHLLSFAGTDTIPAIDLLEDYYGADAEEELVGTSVPASEHSVTSLGSSVDGEFETIKRWITEAYPTGILSIVSDTYDYWKVLTEYLPKLKDEILARKENSLGMAKTVVRPDSGDPVKIICGSMDLKNRKIYEYSELMPHEAGSIEVLWETFGGTINEAGYKVLNPKVGLIYGDSITPQRAYEILDRLEKKGFAASNVVFGVGSFTYQYVTRDTYGYAIKATYGKVNGEVHEIYKDPKTDDGTKKSARGLLRVDLEDGEFVMYDQQTPEQSGEGWLLPAFFNGVIVREYAEANTLAKIRARLQG